MKQAFLVYETEQDINGNIFVYGGLIPVEVEDGQYAMVPDFKWFVLTECSIKLGGKQ